MTTIQPARDIARDPVPLREAIVALLALSDERDQWELRLRAEWRAAYDLGYELGAEAGARRVLDEEAAWRRGTAKLVHHGPSHAKLEELRWGERCPPGQPVHAQFTCACTSPRSRPAGVSPA